MCPGTQRARTHPWTCVSSFGMSRETRHARTHPWTCTAFPSPVVYSASSHFGPFPTPFASHLPVQRANRTSTFAFHLSRISPFPTPIRPPFHPTPSRPFLPPLPAPSASSHPIPLLFSTILSFFCRENVKIDGSGQVEHAKEATGVTKASSSRQNTRSQRMPEGGNRNGTIPTCPKPSILSFWTQFFDNMAERSRKRALLARKGG